MRILVSGSLAYDRIMDFPEKFSDHILPDKLHILNVCFMVNGLKEQFGGTAGNIAYNLALLGEKPIILAGVGKDFDEYEKRLQGFGLSLEGIRKITEEFTAGAYITTDALNNQITGFNPGAMRHPCRYDVQGYRPDDTLAIVAPGCLEDMLTYSTEFKRLAIPYIFDPGQSIPALKSEDMLDMITGSMMLISNDYELELIMRAVNLTKTQILERTGHVITTLGERGCYVANSTGEVHIPATKPRQVLDPTGAGDAFRAGLIKGLLLGKAVVDAAALGAVCAGFAVEEHGTQVHTFTEEEFWARHKTHYQ